VAPTATRPSETEQKRRQRVPTGWRKNSGHTYRRERESERGSHGHPSTWLATYFENQGIRPSVFSIVAIPTSREPDQRIPAERSARTSSHCRHPESARRINQKCDDSGLESAPSSSHPQQERQHKNTKTTRSAADGPILRSSARASSQPRAFAISGFVRRNTRYGIMAKLIRPGQGCDRPTCPGVSIWTVRGPRLQ
jgi:hypothetical protein